MDPAGRGTEARIGFFLDGGQPWPKILEDALRLEELGATSLWLCDFTGATWPLFDCWTLLAALAVRTSRIRLGPLVVNIAYRNPTVVAREALTLDHLSDGRFDLGIGAAGMPKDHATTGVTWWEPSERVGRLSEFVQIVDRELRGKPTTFAGRYYQVTDATLRPATVQQPRPPLVLAANGPRTIKLAARYADVWNTSPIVGADLLAGKRLTSDQALALTQERCQTLDEACAALGRDRASIRRSFAESPSPHQTDTPWTTADAFEDFIGRYQALGFSEFVFFYPPEAIHKAGAVGTGVVEQAMGKVMPGKGTATGSASQPHRQVGT